MVQSLWAFIVVLGIVVFVHEFGHFAVAKLFGMRVFIFSFGFGRRLLGFRWGDTDYRLSLVPLGGYVKLEGEPDDGIGGDPAYEQRALSDGTLVTVESRDYFLNRPRWQRILVYLAGPFMNVVLTVAVLTVFHMSGTYVDARAHDGALVGPVEAGSPAEQAGVRPGDQIVSVDGRAVESWDDAQVALFIRPDAQIKLGLRRAGQPLEVSLRSRSRSHDKMTVGDIGVQPLVRIGEVTAGTPAQQAGLRADDGILAVDGKPMGSFDDMTGLIRASEGRPLEFTLLRGASILQLKVSAAKGPDGVFRVGVGNKLVLRRFGFGAAVRESLVRTWGMTVTTFDTLWRLVTLRLSPKTLSGPLGIAQASGEAAERGGLAGLVLLAALISLQVGILNLVPIAPLDGGHLAILGVESLWRRDLSERSKVWFMNTGFALLMVLIAVVFYSDLSKTKLLGRFLP